MILLFFLFNFFFFFLFLPSDDEEEDVEDDDEELDGGAGPRPTAWFSITVRVHFGAPHFLNRMRTHKGDRHFH